MKNIAKFNFKYKKKLMKSILLFMCIVLGIMIVIFEVYDRQLTEVMDEEAKVTLKNVSSQNIIALKKEIHAKQRFMRSIARRIRLQEEIDIDNLIKELKLYADSYEFYNMGIIDKNGICYTTLDEKLDLSQYDYYKKGLQGTEGISESYLSEDGTTYLNIFTVPIVKKEKVEFILAASYQSKHFSELLNITSFDGKGQTMVIDNEGRLITMPFDGKISNQLKNQVTVKKEKLYLQKEIKKQLEYKQKGFIQYKYKGTDSIAYYEPTEISGWYLVSYVPKDAIYKNANIVNKIILTEKISAYSMVSIVLVLFIFAYQKYQNKISSIIFFDDLTKEKNYEYLKIYFDHLSISERKTKYLFVLDIDNFKVINAMYGTKIGDQILQYIPEIFKEIFIRDDIFKCQSDTFAIVTSKPQEKIPFYIQQFNERIKQDVKNKKTVSFHVSFGICSLGEFDDLHSVYTNALIAKNEIKGNINQNYKFFSEENKNLVIENQKIEGLFNEALRSQEFEVWYQPKCNMRTREVLGAEALIRWRKKDGTLISPSKFIPVFENNGQIIHLDKEVIRQVCKNMDEMRRLGMTIKPISVNLSRVHLENEGIVTYISEMMEKYHIEPKMISFEITESVAIEKNKQLNELVHELHKIGCKVDIDDYGTGSSTLNSLSFSEFDTLKLDKSFIDCIGNQKMNIIIQSTISLAKHLNMEIVVEGVENETQINFLLENQCDVAQGYYFYKPLDKNSYFALHEK